MLPSIARFKPITLARVYHWNECEKKSIFMVPSYSYIFYYQLVK